MPRRERLLDGPLVGQIGLDRVDSGTALGVTRKSAYGPASGLNERFDERATDDTRRADNESVIGHGITRP
jgi:hypothetical protein